MTDWTLAACRDNPELTHDDQRTADAKQMCGGCPLKATCRDTAVGRREPWGVWGGLTVVERERHRTGAPVVTCPECGLDCVPADAADRCGDCQPPARQLAPFQPGYSIVTPHRDLVTSLALDRWGTPDIAALLGFTDHAVRYAQRRWGLPVSAAQRAQRNLQPCGTTAAARRHQRRGETCVACGAAESRRSYDRRRADRSQPTAEEAAA